MKIEIACDQVYCEYNFGGDCHRGEKLTVKMWNGECSDKESINGK